jgi:hypothetical protein
MLALRALTAAGLLAAASACATPAGEQIPRADLAPVETYKVLTADANIPFAGTSIRGFSVDDDDNLILEATGGRMYRVVVWSFCRRELPFAQAIGFDARGGGQFDRFSRVIVRGQRCPVESVDEIENPRRVKDTAAETPPPEASPAGG